MKLLVKLVDFIIILFFRFSLSYLVKTKVKIEVFTIIDTKIKINIVKIFSLISIKKLINIIDLLNLTKLYETFFCKIIIIIVFL